MHAYLTLAETTPTPIETGDAGIVLKRDGSFQVFNADPDFDPANMTPAQKAQGEKLLVLIMALKIPGIMEILTRMAIDPDVFTPEIERGSKN